MVTWHQIDANGLNPFNVVRTSTDDYNASNKDFVITDKTQVNLPSPQVGSYVAVRPLRKTDIVIVRASSGLIYKFDPDVYYTKDRPLGLSTVGVSAGGHISISAPRDGNITGLPPGAQYTGPEVLLFISDGKDWFITEPQDLSKAVPGSIVSRPNDNDTVSFDPKDGVRVETTYEWSRIGIETSSGHSGGTHVYIYRTSDGTLIADKTTQPLSSREIVTFNLDTPLSANEQYNCVIDDDGSNYTVGELEDPSLPYTSSDGNLSITAGAKGATGTSSFALYNIQRVGYIGDLF